MKKFSRFTLIIMLLGLFMVQCTNDDNVIIDPDQIAFDNADVINGGRMYDKFWASETNFVSPSDPSVVLEDITSFGDFYRCKSCHAWDQKGTLASYIDRGPNTGRPSVNSMDLTNVIRNATIRELFDGVMHNNGAAVDPNRTADGANASLGGNDMADYGKILSDAQLWDIVRFLKDGAFDTDQLYDIETTGSYPTGSRTFLNVGQNGDAVAGKAFYDTNCASCHGANGRDDDMGNIIAINESIGRSMGEFAREKPYEMQHKARFGNLGSTPEMLGTGDVPLVDIKNMLKALADASNYPDL
jgi:cytochrome c2